MRRFLPDLVTRELIEFTRRDAKLFQLKGLLKPLDDLDQRWTAPLPAYPLDGGRFAFLTGLTSFRRAVQTGSLDGTRLEQVLIRDKGPFPLFRSSNLILS